MKQYVAEKISHEKILRPNEYIDIPFAPKNRGNIQIQSEAIGSPYASWLMLSQKIELFQGKNSSPLACIGNKVRGALSLSVDFPSIEVNTNIQLYARVTNMDAVAEKFRIEISYPGDYLIKRLTISEATLHSIFDSTINKMKIRLTAGEKESFIVFPANLRIPDTRFTIPDFDYMIDKLWPIPDIHIQEHINSINSCDIKYFIKPPADAFPAGFLHIVIRFEEIDAEIIGTYHCQLHNVALVIDLDLLIKDREILYDKQRVRVCFSFDLHIFGVDDKVKNFVLKPITNYIENIRAIIEHKIRSIFCREKTHAMIAHALGGYLYPILGTTVNIINSTVTANALHIDYINS